MNQFFSKLKQINKKWYIPIGILFAIGIYFLPPVHDRLSTRVELLQTRIIYFFNPPSEAVFQPSEQNPLTVETAVGTARAEMMLTLTPASTPTLKPASTLQPTVTPTPLPDSVVLDGITYVTQKGRWNYCGPANLTMALNFWGWEGDRDDVAMVVKPGSPDLKKDFIQRGQPDKNVMPYELIDFVNNQTTEYRALSRYGGNIELIKSLIAAGFPVTIEKGTYDNDAAGIYSWFGHYLFTTGYDDAKGGFIVQDTNLENGKNLLSNYEDYQDGWRAFNYLFMVVYPAQREAEVLSLLGPWADETWATQHALEIAEIETQSLEGNDLFFAWFNKGTSLVALNRYGEASIAYDEAFLFEWEETKAQPRPYRMVWYQTGPYFAYYYSARYQDVINLGNVTLKVVPTLEESLLWRGRAYYMIGDTQSAINDYRAALQVHANWFPAVQALQELGVQP
jgi:tetratricopeptide (TPR) repeat protein